MSEQRTAYGREENELVIHHKFVIHQSILEHCADLLDTENVIYHQRNLGISDPVDREESELHIRMANAALNEYEKTMFGEISDLEKWQSTAKKLAEKLQHLLELHSAEQEALRPPTPMMWYNATLEGSAALEQFKTLTNGK